MATTRKAKAAGRTKRTKGGRGPAPRGGPRRKRAPRPFDAATARGHRAGGKASPKRNVVAIAAPTRQEGPDSARPTAVAIAKAALDKKAEDVTVLDVRGLTSYADYFVVVTADSDRQASAIADHVEETMKRQGVPKVSVEGYETGRWILVDYGDVVAHVMNKESRGFYDLEGLWADAPRFQVEG